MQARVIRRIVAVLPWTAVPGQRDPAPDLVRRVTPIVVARIPLDNVAQVWHGNLMTTTRYIAKCKSCNCVTSTLASNVNRADADMGALFHDDTGASGAFGNLAIRCRSCGKARRAVAVAGKFSAKHVCNAKCLASTSGKCECSCGGKNHGAAFGA